MIQLNVRALVLHNGWVGAVQMMLLERRWHAAERLEVLRMQEAELLGDCKHVHKSGFTALHRFVKLQCVQKLKPRRRLVVREVQVVFQVVVRVRDIDLLSIRTQDT
jgi:hypothetical protein